jgi:hypothetical protein
VAGGQGVRALDAFEQDVSGEAVGDDDVGVAAEGHVVPLDVAGVAGARRQRGVGQRDRGDPAQPVALARLGADGQQAHARGPDAVRGRRVGRPHHGELRQLRRGDVGAGADVEQHDRTAQRRQRRAHSGPAHARLPPESVHGGRDGGAAGSGGDETDGPAVRDGRHPGPHRGVGAHGAQRRVGHADHPGAPDRPTRKSRRAGGSAPMISSATSAGPTSSSERSGSAS